MVKRENSLVDGSVLIYRIAAALEEATEWGARYGHSILILT